MSVNTAKLSEVVAVSAAPDWVSVSDWKQVSCFVSETAASIQLQQATDGTGTGAKDLGTATTGGKVTAINDSLDTNGGFTYVNAVVTGGVTPESVVVRSNGRFAPE